jgi:glycosyltransferase involved in cell wall biosynthesis
LSVDIEQSSDLKRIRVGMIADYPISERLMQQLQIREAPSFAHTAVTNLVEGLSSQKQIELEIIRGVKDLGAPYVRELFPNARLHLVPIKKRSGMPVAYIPRIVALRRYMRDLHCDVVHAQGTEKGNGWIGLWLRTPLVVTLHGILQVTHKVTPPPWHSPEHMGWVLERITFRRCRDFIAISDYVVRLLETYAPKATVHSVPNAVRDRFFVEGVPAKADEPTAIYIGRISPEKGVEELVQAARIMDAQGLKGRVKIVGRASGRHGKEYEERCKRLATGLDNTVVEFTGVIDESDLMIQLRKAWCLVLPSHDENFSMVIAEAMASGTPPVGYRARAIPDRIDHGLNGLLVEEGDVQDLAMTVLQLLRDRSRVASLAEAGMKKARDWHQDRVAAETSSVYERIVRTH